MDDFSKLSILDLDTTFKDEDLNAISSLSISEEEQRINDASTLPPQILNKFMPHFPSSPSPLRQSVVIGNECDKMDVDEIETDPFDDPEILSDLDNDELPGDKESENEQSVSPSVNGTVVLKALLSPTSLGVAAATKTDNYAVATELSNSEQVITSIPEITESCGYSLSESDFANLRQRSQYQPVQVAINNHHYYYPSPHIPYEDPFVEAPLQLPNPWSSTSKPASRSTYALVSYLQLLLNSLTLLVIFSFLTLFVRAVKSDLRSAWQHTKEEFDFESSKCRSQYLANNCGPETVVPALEHLCNEWEKCMNRNNDIFFRARSTITASMFGDIINSFIEPLGWKTLIVISIGLAIWCFSSNFILGYARAKTYYSKHNDQKAIQN